MFRSTLDISQCTSDEAQADQNADPRPALERMSSGDLYHASHPDICAATNHAKALAQQFNNVDLSAADAQQRTAQICEKLFGTWDPSVTIHRNLQVDYGFNIHLGPDVFINFDAILLDVCPITIGAGTLIGPRVQLLTPLHPANNHQLRRAGWEYGAPITIGENCWFGGGVTVCPGVTIGDNVVIGAGSVVTRDIPSGVLAVGSPARIVKEL